MRTRKQVKKPVLKLLGLAGLAGVAATGAVLARNERQRRAYTADDVRSRLHERHAALAAVPEPDPDLARAPSTGQAGGGARGLLGRLPFLRRR
ncbi:hypothetical protein [Trujillonella endophytica]|uniref:Secreted protein n=1 Tax=Trujillonella endophytica TaxID=673521 RepID=A0A1H8PA37_9ACTN|nr:hypothetical protein [Trujillella endophytica]SEO38403.1 hypothetical protein SAMN05660991_00037 [Trujillella endophytica]